MADRVDVVDTDNPFVLRELDLPAKVMQMLDQGAEDFSVSGLCLGGHKSNDVLCKVGVEFAVIVLDTIGAVGTVGSHGDVAFYGVGTKKVAIRPRFGRIVRAKSDDVSLSYVESKMEVAFRGRIDGSRTIYEATTRTCKG